MDQPQAKRTKRRDCATTSSPTQHGKQLCEDIYCLHEPEEKFEVEIVFIHGLQLAKDDLTNAYWKAWLVRDGTKDECWPMTWLPKKFPNARILSLSYDAYAWRTSTTGRMDAYSLGESLVQSMISQDNGIGQNDCPVVFVCHSLGGLIAKQIVVRGHQFSNDKRICKLLGNLKAFFFYATPHQGSKLANLVGHLPFLFKSPLVKYLEVMNGEVGRLDNEFENIHRNVGKGAWKFYAVGETHATLCGPFNAMVVEEASARLHSHNFISVPANHINVSKPESETDKGFLHLVRCIREVVEDVNKNHGYLLELPKLVGIEDKLEEVWNKMEGHPIVGLVGMGGIGKTTLSKQLYNCEKRRKQFEKFSFLEDVTSRGSEASRKQLYRDLCDKTWDDGNVNSQLEDIKQCIVMRKVLLVVDDVSVEKDLEKLLVHVFKDGKRGSKVIVTTRRKDVLYDYRHGIYDVGLLDENDALELFSYYVFHEVEDEDRQQLDDQAKDIVKACGKLPLTLEVIGQFLKKYNDKEIGERIGIWEEALQRLRKAKAFDGCNDDKLWGRLKISYDGLAKDEQSMFLDFACIFCEISNIYPYFHIRKNWLARIWNSPIGIQNLINRSLIKWNPDIKSLVMHDQLRDMGRGIVKEVGNENMSRIWRKEEALNFTLQNKNCKTMEALFFGMDYQNSKSIEEKTEEFVKEQEEEFAKLKTDEGAFEKLRLLVLTKSSSKVVEYYVQLCLKELTWLCLDNTMIRCQSLKNLGSFTDLRVLEMNYCHELIELPPSIGNLSLLTELQLSDCEALKTLPDTIGNLSLLTKLKLSGCVALKTLPNTIGKLEKLQILKLRSCRSLEGLPTSIGGLTSLKMLNCRYCISLAEVPTQVGQLRKLEALSFEGCSQLKTLCIFEAKMDHLCELNLGMCDGLSTFELLGNLHHLKTLEIGSNNLWIDNLPNQLRQLSQLQLLNLSDCEKLNEGILETICKGQLCTNHLEHLKLSFFPDCELPPCLKSLCLTNGNQVEKLPESICNLLHLERLYLYDHGRSLKVLPDALCKLKTLKTLELRNFLFLERLPTDLGCLSSLQKLFISYCTKLVELPSSICNLFQLQKLDLWQCNNLKRLPKDFNKLIQLSELIIHDCDKLEWWEPDQISILRKLKDIGCRMQFFRFVNKLIELRDDGAHTNTITRSVIIPHSYEFDPFAYHDDANEGGEEGSNDDANEGGEEGFNDDANEGGEEGSNVDANEGEKP